ncbi:3'-5' exonuclease [Paraferrimonas sedimenticola]|uniref:DNA polymerase III subunit epsilon n=1 Tax=Paraferrimonas sedimenticola TaxID=375674 RepID=A0AA37W1S8_9GAMM|nr:3'-5' exonuclease [Paraferrimonas sedimenticola]GLP96672.1 DNA polymerase III subunit epsilon [Paraferrimonas sedimenticola]
MPPWVWRWREWRAKHDWQRALLGGVREQWRTPVNQARLMVFDLEMTGLDAQQDQLLAIGMVPIIDGCILPGRGKHVYVQIDGSVGQSAVIHKIHDNQLEQALSPEQAFDWWCKQMAGFVPVAHHGGLDFGFLRVTAQRQTGQDFKMPWVDTLVLEQRRLTMREQTIKPGDLTLSACRQRYRLPQYQAHHALSDAFATAELLLAQLAQMGGSDKIEVGSLL